MHTYIFTHTCVYVYIYIYNMLYTHTHILVFEGHIHMCVCIYTYIYIYIYIYGRCSNLHSGKWAQTPELRIATRAFWASDKQLVLHGARSCHDICHITYGVFYFVCNHDNHRNAKQDTARVKIISSVESPLGWRHTTPTLVVSCFGESNRQSAFYLPPRK